MPSVIPDILRPLNFIMKELFYTILYEPLFNIFVWLYDIVPDVGIVILILTVIIKLALYPLTGKSINILVFSNEEVFAWPYIEKISRISELPIFAKSALVDKLNL